MHNVESLPCTRDLCVGLVILFCQLCSELCEPSLSQSEAEEKAVEFPRAKKAIKLIKVCGLALFPDLKTKCGRPVCYCSWCSP